jgi:hypothetical protein
MSALLSVTIQEFKATPRQKIAMRRVHFRTIDLINDLVVGITFTDHQCSINLTDNTFLCSCNDRSCRKRACKHVLRLHEKYIELKSILEEKKYWINPVINRCK